ncbi:MAG TPA: Holliday junction branch migration protein RuvA [Porphyromonadaceae bacterium]|nr:Holliday junction branch migration protein RuvA [Porphyromonadaceae bacterium]
MFEFIQGKLYELTPTSVVLHCNGIGYFVNISLNTYSSLQGKEEALLYTYEAIREDAFVLYGFLEKKEREMFLMLIMVSGVGANIARMILSSFSPQELANAVAEGNVSLLKSIKGIGSKTAERIIVDLKDKVKKDFSSSSDSSSSVSPLYTEAEEAIDALVALGFSKVPAQKAIHSIIKKNSSPLEVGALVKMALKIL